MIVGFKVTFSSTHCSVLDKTDKLILLCPREQNVYTCDLDLCAYVDNVCFISSNDDPWLWHRRLGHINMKLIKTKSSKENICGIPKLKFIKDHICETCEIGKQVRASHKLKFIASTSRPFRIIAYRLG